ncbi:AlpA family phage regulatory protein [Seongchinamella sediminis]|uniref:AlpA family phage regulatory protein n=1 Tax=Seongchinamella sediminis TaxID=2283635 RepID=A0A3L7DUE6_9GAMM|nr:AlpA family phage regulatory protein [Seongchinamella sediminis]RLQ20149.1 AlpA family phage regulatory protein [Seongchinamella sediminis]
MKNIQNSHASPGKSSELPAFISIKQLQAMLGGKSRSTINRWRNDGHLPPPIQIGANTVVWPLEEILQWRDSLIHGGA